MDKSKLPATEEQVSVPITTTASQQGENNPELIGGRPKIKQYQTGNKFRLGDSVYVSDGGRGLQGPYLIAVVLDGRKYTLSFENGAKVENGRAFGEESLQFVS